jgi:hypothetical protein
LVWGRHVGKQLSPAPLFPFYFNDWHGSEKGSIPWNMGAAHGRRQGPRKDSPAGPPEPAPPAGGAQIPDRRKQGLTSPPAGSRMAPSRMSHHRSPILIVMKGSLV